MQRLNPKLLWASAMHNKNYNSNQVQQCSETVSAITVRIHGFIGYIVNVHNLHYMHTEYTGKLQKYILPYVS